MTLSAPSPWAVTLSPGCGASALRHDDRRSAVCGEWSNEGSSGHRDAAAPGLPAGPGVVSVAPLLVHLVGADAVDPHGDGWEELLPYHRRTAVRSPSERVVGPPAR